MQYQLKLTPKAQRALRFLAERLRKDVSEILLDLREDPTPADSKPGKSGRENCYLCEDAGLGKGDPGHHWASDHNPHLAAMLESIDQGIGQIAFVRDEAEQITGYRLTRHAKHLHFAR